MREASFVDAAWSVRDPGPRCASILLASAECSNVATFTQARCPVTITTLSSREFNQDTSRAKKAAMEGPVFITDRGRPAHVLLSIEQYEALTGPAPNIVDLLALPGVEDVDFDPPRAGTLYRPADLS